MENKEKIEQQRMIVAEALKEQMVRKGLLQKDVADALGMNKAALSKIMNGLVSPTVDTLSRIAEVIGVRIAFVPIDAKTANCANCRCHVTEDGEEVCILRKGRARFIQLDMRCDAHMF